MATHDVTSGGGADGGGADGACIDDTADNKNASIETHAKRERSLMTAAEGQPSTAQCCAADRTEGVASAAAARGNAADAESTTTVPSLSSTGPSGSIEEGAATATAASTSSDVGDHTEVMRSAIEHADSLIMSGWAGAQRRLWRSGSASAHLHEPLPERTPGPAQQRRDQRLNETNLQRALRIGGGGNSGGSSSGDGGRAGGRLAPYMRGAPAATPHATSHAHPYYNSDGSLARDPLPDARGGSGGGGTRLGDGDLEMGLGLATAGDSSGAVEGTTSTSNTDAAATGGTTTTTTTTSTRLDLQLAMRWLEQALPFSFLLMLVFLQQHWLGLMAFASSTLLLCRANDVVKRQVALREGRRAATLALTAVSLVLFLCVVLPLPVPGGALWRHLLLLPPTRVPTFWEALWRVVMMDTLARNLSILAKIAVLLMGRQTAGPGFRRQAASLTLVEYVSLLYRVLLPTPVWARFFLDKAAYGHFFSSLTTGLYLTFKVTAAVERACSLFLALQAFAKCDAHCGKAATPEEVAEAGNLCAICHEGMKTPVMLPCAHVFCDDCVAEWFDHAGEAQERTCPLCRAVVKSQGLKSTYGDGTTGLMLQIF